MKVFISADIEGATGVVAWSQCGANDGTHYDFPKARTLLTQDVNAAIRGARTAGATAIVVRDAHGNGKTLRIEDLEPGAELISGRGAHPDGMMAGIGRSFGAAILVGYHAMAGTEAGIMEHTISRGVHRMTINGMPAGEIALSAAVAGAYGVPIVAVTSDAAGCAEAEALIPGLRTAVVKQGMGRYTGLLHHPSETARAIERVAREAVERVATVQPWIPDLPIRLSIEFHHTERADMAALLVGTHRKDAYTIEYEAQTPLEMHRVARQIIAMGGLGVQSNE